MKKISLYMVVATIALFMQSCLHDNDEIFSQSAAERVDAAVAEASQLLESSEYGWILHYYAGAEYEYGGLNFSTKFKNGKVTMTQQGNTDQQGNYVTMTSKYRLSRDQGPVLAFDTYNDLLHSWGDPMGDNAPTDVEGWQADYEFVIMNISEDKNTITLKGKKFGNKMVLERLTKPAKDYLDEASLLAGYLEKNFNTLLLESDGKKAFFITDGNAYTIKYQTDDGTVSDMEVKYNYTDKGVLFAEPIELFGQTISGFNAEITASADGKVDGRFPLSDDPSKQLTVPVINPKDPNVLFKNFNWYVAASKLGSTAKKGFDAFVAGCAGEGEKIGYIFLGTLTRYPTMFGIEFNSGGYSGVALVDVEADMFSPNLVTLSLNQYDQNGNYYANNCNFGQFAGALFNTFQIEIDNVDNPKTMKMTDVNDPENTMTLVTDVINNPADN